MSESIKCPNCGATIDIKHMKNANCVYCGAAIPDLYDYFKKELDINLEYKRQQHRVEEEQQKADIEKQRLTHENRQLILKLIIAVILVFLGLTPFLLVWTLLHR